MGNHRKQRAGEHRSMRSMLFEFLPYLKRQTGKLIVAYSVSLVAVALTLLLPWPVKFLIDEVLADDGSLPLLGTLPVIQQVALLAGSMLLLAALAAIAQAADKILHARVRERFTYQLRGDLIDRVYRMSRASRQAEMSGELTLRLVSDSQLVGKLFCKTIPTALKHAATAALALVSMMLISLPLGLLALLMAAVLVSILRYFGPQLANAAARKRNRQGRVAALTQETMHGIEHVQAMALETQAKERYLDEAAQSLHAGVAEVRIAARFERNAQLIAGLALALTAGAGGIAVVNGQMPLGTLTVCLAYITQLLRPIEKLNDIATSMTRGAARADRVCKLFETENAVSIDAQGKMPGRLESIECSALHFCYPDNPADTIAGFCHRFRRGECTVVVGPSGCGKSTLLRLLLRLQTPRSGTITANGLDYQTIDARALRTQFAVLLQDAHLFAGSIRQILTELNGAASDEQLRQALQDMQLREIVESMPSGLDTRIDETGTRLSGGQRSRLLLARALISDRPALLLDEPFANIDAVSRQIILDRLDVARHDHLIIAITHDQALLKIADHIIDETGLCVPLDERTGLAPVQAQEVAREIRLYG